MTVSVLDQRPTKHILFLFYILNILLIRNASSVLSLNSVHRASAAIQVNSQLQLSNSVVSGAVIELSTDVFLSSQLIIADINNLVINGLGKFKLDGSSTTHCVSINGTNTSVTFLGLTISNCFTNEFGGGISVSGSHLEMYQCNLIDNFSKSSGGAIAVYGGGTLAVVGCSFVGNNAAAFGGGIYATNSGSLSLTDSLFSLNNATSFGGGLLIEESYLYMSACVFANNHAYKGAALGLRYYSGAQVSETEFYRNIAQSQGGAILVRYSSTVSMFYSCN
jgi:predicted outer membrane repeat protein